MNEKRVVGDALTFDDVLIVPLKSDVVPTEVRTNTRLTNRIAWVSDQRQYPGVLSGPVMYTASIAYHSDGLPYLSNKTGYFEIWAVDVRADGSGALVASSPRQLTQDLHVDAASGLSWGR